jgi:hypothetical protein
VQQGLVEALVDLAAQSRDVRLHDVGLGIEVEVPDLLQQHRAGHDLAAWRIRYSRILNSWASSSMRLPAARHGAGQQVDLEVAGAQRGRRHDRRPAGQRA